MLHWVKKSWNSTAIGLRPIIHCNTVEGTPPFCISFWTAAKNIQYCHKNSALAPNSWPIISEESALEPFNRLEVGTNDVKFHNISRSQSESLSHLIHVLDETSEVLAWRHDLVGAFISSTFKTEPICGKQGRIQRQSGKVFFVGGLKLSAVNKSSPLV